MSQFFKYAIHGRFSCFSQLPQRCFRVRELCFSVSQTSIDFSATNFSVLRKICFSSLCRTLDLSTGLKVSAVSSFVVRSMSISATLTSATSQVASECEEVVELLTATEDDHDGVIIDMISPMDAGVFTSSLRASISKWRQQGKKGVWIKLPIELVNLVQPAVEEGFWYHHAEPKYLMLVYWIPDTVHTLPINATHRVGVGAFVMNDKREVLAVREKNGKFRGSGIWKFPTGVIDEGEDIFAGAIREVKEETGINTEFVEILGFRQSHKSFFEKSDLFFMCMLRPLTFDIQKQESEIEEAQWMPIEEYTAQPFVQKREHFRKFTEICLARAEKRYCGFSEVPATTGLSGQTSYMYLNSRDLNQNQPGNQS